MQAIQFVSLLRPILYLKNPESNAAKNGLTMNRNILISAGALTFEGELFDSPTADAVWNMLPHTAKVHTWGDEIYFTVPVQVELEEDAVEVVAAGDLGYWPSGPAFCIFFGPTPISTAGEIRPASAVNIFGKLGGDLALLKNVGSGSEVTISRAQAA